MKASSLLRAAIIGLPFATLSALTGNAMAAEADETAPSSSLSSPLSVPGLSVTGGSSKFDAKNQTDNPCEISTSYVDMPGMSEAFTLGGTAKDEVVVMFQGEWIPNTGRPIIRLLIDGVVQPGPGDDASPFAPWEGTEVGTTGFNFISKQLTPGAHTAKIQWASVLGDSVCVDERSLIILHK